MDMEEKHRCVRLWLEQTFVDQPIPQYEITEKTINILYNLMLKNQLCDRQARVVIEDHQQKVEEYNTEAQRLSRILHQVGLSSASLSQSGFMSLRTMASVALLLQLKDASTTNYLLGLCALSQSSMKANEERRSEKLLSSQLFTKTKAALLKSDSLKRALDALEEQVKHQGPDLNMKAKEAAMLHTKVRDYRHQIKDKHRQLLESGVNPELYHQAIVKRAEELQAIKDKMAPMMVKLDSYHSLPPDVALATVRLEEAKRELSSLEVELSKNIDLMHM